MKKRTILTAGVALLALAACSRRNDAASNGTVVSNSGLQVNAIGAATSCLSPEDMTRQVSEFSQEKRRELVACMNTATARQINTQLPKLLDEYTRLDRISTEGPLLTYHYTVLSTPPGVGGDLGGRLETSTRRLTCANRQARQALEWGGSYGFRWVDNQGSLIHEMRIDAC